MSSTAGRDADPEAGRRMSEAIFSRLVEALTRRWAVEVSRDGCVAIVSPRKDGGLAFVRDVCLHERESLLKLVEVCGAVVLRGFEVVDTKSYERLMTECCGLAPVFEADSLKKSQLILKAADRAPRGSGTLLNLPVDPTLQGPHIEYGWRSRRPRYISFWCEVEPRDMGETALFDMGGSYTALDERLRPCFDDCASIYPAYGERLAVDSVLIHPQTHRRCLVLWYFESPLADHAVAAYRKTAHGRKNYFQEMRPNRAVNDPLLHLLVRDGGEFALSDAQKSELMDCVYRNAQYVRWRRSDVLVIDNISVAHGRMPTHSPRRLVAGYWNEEDVRQYSPRPGLADDCPVAAGASRSPEYVTRVISEIRSGRFKM